MDTVNNTSKKIALSGKCSCKEYGPMTYSYCHTIVLRTMQMYFEENDFMIYSENMFFRPTMCQALSKTFQIEM